MGYIRILKRDAKKILLDDSMTYLFLLNKQNKGKILYIKTEALISFLEANGIEITNEELKDLEMKLKEERKKWWHNYRKILYQRNQVNKSTLKGQPEEKDKEKVEELECVV
ncbi:hypothetical protein V4D30_01145 [Thermodesulfovibrio sp. 3907-1M]|uniref:Uncharacterized protein n=1 Tax=Thermodesulfovibrio autotrophicus TaxID=3118333 RepID=A0AAU8H044_9BACT